MFTVAAKQEAFEESAKLKNQFRTLDEDEVEFLDSVLESTRAKEEAVKKETTEQLDLFRRQQDEADKKLREGENGREVEEAGSPIVGESEWAVGSRKRKRVKEKEVLKGVKIRRSSSTQLGIASPDTGQKRSEEKSAPPKTLLGTPLEKGSQQNQKSASPPTSSSKVATKATNPDTSSKPKPVPGLGLAAYSSDEDD